MTKVFFIQNIDDLPEEERGLLLKQLESDTFVLEITKIISTKSNLDYKVSTIYNPNNKSGFGGIQLSILW